jgi:predicted RNA-binding protein with TRAM domain
MENNRYGMSTMRNPPVQEGNTYTVKVESTGREGDGIAKIDGFVIFIPGAKVGEELEVKINKVTRRVGFAEKLESEGSETPQEAEDSESPEENQEQEETEESERPEENQKTEETEELDKPPDT